MIIRDMIFIVDEPKIEFYNQEDPLERKLHALWNKGLEMYTPEHFLLIDPFLKEPTPEEKFEILRTRLHSQINLHATVAIYLLEWEHRKRMAGTNIL